MLYQWELTGEPIEQVARSFWELRSTAEATRDRADALALGACRERERLDAAIAAAVIRWRPDRIAAVDRSLLRLAAYELLCEPATPAAVVIDEAVEMAKRFSEAEAPAFVNGVLDAIRRRHRGDPQAHAAVRQRGGEE